MKNRVLIIMLAFLLLNAYIFNTILVARSETEHKSEQTRKYIKKEIYKYDLTWMGIKAGSARLEFLENTSTVIIKSRATSADWVSIFYPVDDRVKSSINRYTEKDKILLRAQNYRIKIKEGRHRRDKEVIFYPERNEAIYINHIDDERETHRIPEDVLDPLSGFYQLRLQELKPDSKLSIKIFDSKKVWNVKIDVIGRETIETEAGRFKTIVVKPDLKSEGIFNRKGEILIYLTDDDRHIPVLLKTKVLIGYVEAELVGGKF